MEDYKVKPPLLSIENLNVCYGHTPVLRGVSMTVEPGEVLGVVGESGSGKSTAIYAALGILGTGGAITGGSIHYGGQELSALPSEDLRRLRGKELALIAQHPMASFHPTRRLKSQLRELVRNHGGMTYQEAEERMLALLSGMNLPHGKGILNRYALELSGGMCQRVSIAMAMVLRPKLLFADEPTSALDVTVQAQVVQELRRIQEESGTGMMIVSHNMGLIAHMADRIVVMYGGLVLEYGTPTQLLRHPAHPYTQNLIRAIPRLHAPAPRGIRTCPPDRRAQGCPFHGGCRVGSPGCLEGLSSPEEREAGHGSRCWRHLGEGAMA